MTYLAVPYSHADKAVRECRFISANRAAFRLMQRGDVVFSPISHSYPIECESGMIGDHKFWAKQDDAFQKHATKVCVLMIPGWEDSRGVTLEIGLAQAAGIPVEYLSEDWALPICYSESASKLRSYETVQPASETRRKSACEIAEELTKGDRNDDYGDAYTNASSFAAIMTGILWRKLRDPVNEPITPKESFLCMIGSKLSRESNKPKRDNQIDTIGYALLIDNDPRFK